MYVRHFFKMLFALIVMAIVGLAGLVAVNHFSKNQETPKTGLQAIPPAGAGDAPVKMNPLH